MPAYARNMPITGCKCSVVSVVAGQLWKPANRCSGDGGCYSSIIRGLQRFGRMSKRSASGKKEVLERALHLYVAIYEASTHVCPRFEASKFRFLAAAFDDTYQLLGTCVSSSIRVLAIMTLGAAFLKMYCNIRGKLPESLANLEAGKKYLSKFQKICRRQEAELKLVEKETARGVEEAIRKKVQETLSSEEIKSQIDVKIQEARKKMFEEIAVQLEKKKEQALTEARKKEEQERREKEDLERMLEENRRKIEEAQRREAEEQTRKEEQRYRELEAQQRQKEEALRRKRLEEEQHRAEQMKILGKQNSCPKLSFALGMKG